MHRTATTAILALAAIAATLPASAAKLNGAARYGIDAKVADMVYARPKLPPTRNGSSAASCRPRSSGPARGPEPSPPEAGNRKKISVTGGINVKNKPWQN